MRTLIRFSIIVLFLVLGLQAVTAQTSPTRLRLKQLELAPDSTEHVITSDTNRVAVWTKLDSVLFGTVTGPLTSGRIPRATGTYTLGDGVLRDDGTLLALGGVTVSGYSFYDYSTGAWRVATGTTAQRPTNIAGLLRYNTSLGYSETANGSAWLQSDFPVGASTNTIRHNGTSWIASTNLINDGTVVRAAGATNRIHLFPSDFTDGQTFNGQISLLNNAEAAAAKLAVGGSQLWLRVIGGLSGTGRGILMSPNGAAVLTATNTLLTLNTASAATLQSWLLNGTQVASLSAETGANAHLLLRSNVTTANRGISNYHHQNAVAGAYQGFFRSRGTASAQTALQNGDIIGASVFRPYDGSNYTVDNCYFGGNVSGVVSSGNTPSSLFFIAGPTQSYLPDLLIHDSGNVGIGSSSTGDITSAVNAPPRQLTVYGEARITDLTTDTPTRIVGADADGDLGAVSEGYGINITGGALEVDTTQIATQSDLASVSGTTLYTADGTIATDRTVTIGSDKTLTISGTTPDLPGYSFTEKKGYNSDWDTWGNYRLIYTDDYFTNFIQGILNYDSTVFVRLSAGDWVGDHFVSMQMDEAGNLSLSGFDDSGTSAGLNLSDNVTVGGYGTRLQGGAGIEFDTDTGGKFVYQVNNTTEAQLDATGLGLAGSTPAHTLDMEAATDAVDMPGGTTAQRPTNESELLRYNSDNARMEYADGTNWRDLLPATSTTGAAILPSGTTGQRDGSPANGYIRYNSTIGELEAYVQSAWATVQASPRSYADMVGSGAAQYTVVSTEIIDTVTNIVAVGFTHSAGVLTYTGTTNKNFLVNISAVVGEADTDAATAVLRLYQNSSIKGVTQQYCALQDEKYAVSISRIVTLATSDTLDCRLATGGDWIVSNFYFNVTPID